jgi:hypothetical protein
MAERRLWEYNAVWEEQMTTITLPANIESPLVEEARRRGITPERLALDTLRQRFTPSVASPSAEPPESTLADLLTGYVGLVEGSTEALSERCGERFAQGLTEAQSRESS